MAKGDITTVDGVEYVQAHEDGYEERCQAQLIAWVEGRPEHNVVDGECCPDFSCCNEKVNTPKHVRQLFARAKAEGDEKTKMALLGSFLGDAIASIDVKAHIVGDGGKYD